MHREITSRIINAALRVHCELGNGFLEQVYHKALGIEFRHMNIQYIHEYPFSVYYRGEESGQYRADFFVENRVIVELKAIKALDNSHGSVVLHYLKATGNRVGLLLNFGAPSLEIRRLTRRREEQTTARSLRSLDFGD